MNQITGALLILTALIGSYTHAQTLPQPTLILESGANDDVQVAHALSIRLRSDYCYHQFILAQGADAPLTDLSLTVEFGNSDQLVQQTTLDFARLGGTFVDEKFISFGLNSPCQVDEFRITSFEAMRGEEAISLGNGLRLTTAYLTELPVTQGLPLNTSSASVFNDTDLLREKEVKCISGRANLRGGPSTSNVVLGTLRPNEEQREVEIISEVSGGDWFEVQTALGNGYLHHTLLGDC